MSEYDMPERDINDPKFYESDHVESSFEIREDFLGDFDAVVKMYTDGRDWIEDDVKDIIQNLVKVHVNKYDYDRQELGIKAIADLREQIEKEVGTMMGVDVVEVEMD